MLERAHRFFRNPLDLTLKRRTQHMADEARKYGQEPKENVYDVTKPFPASTFARWSEGSDLHAGSWDKLYHEQRAAGVFGDTQENLGRKKMTVLRPHIP